MTATQRPDRRISYHERWEQACARNVVVDLVVPRPGRLGHVKDGSGMVIAPDSTNPDAVHVYFEGFVFGAAQWAGTDARTRWEAACRIAADRAVVRYPTVAHMFATTDDIVVVGHLECATTTLTVTDPVTLERWLTNGGPGR